MVDITVPASTCMTKPIRSYHANMLSRDQSTSRSGLNDYIESSRVVCDHQLSLGIHSVTNIVTSEVDRRLCEIATNVASFTESCVPACVTVSVKTQLELRIKNWK